MIELLNSNTETVEKYLKPLRIYLNRTDIKLEVQIKRKRVVWLLFVKNYLIIKTFNEEDAERLLEFRKGVTDKKGHISYTSRWIKRK